MQAEIARLTARQVLTRGRLIVLAVGVALPPFLMALYAAGNATVDPEEAVARLCDALVLPLVLPILALVIGAAAFGNEVEDGTLFYLVMKPIARWRIVAAKLGVSVLIVVTLVCASTLAAALIAGHEAATLRTGAAFAAGAAAGALAYTTLFLFLGLVTGRAILVGLLYVFLWEGALGGVLAGLRAVSIRQYARGVAGALADLSPLVFEARLTGAGALAGVVVVTVMSFVLTARRLEVMDIE
jgi:ABC-2 type transport system permease protein